MSKRKRKEKNHISRLSAKKNETRQRVIALLGGVAIVVASIYGYNKTSTRQRVLETGTMRSAQVTKLTSKRTISTMYVTINDRELSAGETFGDYRDIEVGDTIDVWFRADENLVVPNGKESYQVTLFFEYFTFAIGVGLILMVFLYRGKRQRP
jgi:hypothetical protein